MDNILKELDELLSKHNTEPAGFLRMSMPSTIEEQNEWYRQRQHLVTLGYLEHQDLRMIAGWPEQWRITTKGRLFLRSGGFVGDWKRERGARRWQHAKTVATVAYSLMVLGVAIWAVWVEMGRN